MVFCLTLLLARPAFCQSTELKLGEILKRAEQSELQKQFSRAADEYREASRLQPSPAIYEKLGLACFLGTSYDEAIDAFSRAIRLSPDLWASHLFLGISLYKTNRFEEALPHINRALRLNPAENDAQYWLGITYGALGDYHQAIEHLRTALTNAPESVDVMYALTEMYFDFSTVLLSRSESLHLDRDREEALERQLLGATTATESREQTAGSLEELEERYVNVLKSPRPDREGLYILGRIYNGLAEAMTRTVWTLEPDSYRSHQLLGEAYEAEDNFDQALAEYRQALRLFPDAPGLHYFIGHAYWQMKRFNEAIPQLEKELALNPYHASANYVLGHIYLYIDRQQPGMAARYLQRAVEAKPDFLEARKQWGKALSLLHEDQKAIEELTLVAQANPEDDSTHYLLAGIYSRMGLREKAQDELRTFDTLRQLRHHHDQPGDGPK